MNPKKKTQFSSIQFPRILPWKHEALSGFL